MFLVIFRVNLLIVSRLRSLTYCLTSEKFRCSGSVFVDSALRCRVSHLSLCSCCESRLLPARYAWVSDLVAFVLPYYCAKAYSVVLRCYAKCCYFASYVSCCDGRYWAHNRCFEAYEAAPAAGGYCCIAVYNRCLRACCEAYVPAEVYCVIRVGYVHRRNAYTPCDEHDYDSTGCGYSALPYRTYTNLWDSRERRVVVLPKSIDFHSGSRTTHCLHHSRS